ncbi:MAG: hypothetical protein COX79_01815 [Candidatus Levybacteria bacterium CG_4_10_14_0_2_um_filter_36_16]|nr:MAG: hypothetical protein AUK12_00375 [Candidatus Levybacteria bacterium CG2_30_37_29]PIR79285.1 MAG: hypothetical protein COU26_02020 [Candidatus Levybacteria bacterium CG10_big_fil_rev_8_21_14_0_10_36_30]PIZ97570.1 MAG: hypothetical protein COX79_01815 [Candidatus Levybacteria bacterium CG_4_10_14_0_2_um_filter_36_16]
MAKARMLHKKISVSTQVNKLYLPARLLFTWMIAHADDEGRLKGDADYIRAIVVPMTKWSFKKIGNYLEEIKNAGLIYYWQQNGEWFVEFIKWREHQSIRSDRYISSLLPSFMKGTDDKLATNSQPDDNQKPTQDNIVQSKIKQENFNKSEYKEDADKTSKVINPRTFTPSNDGESIALETYKRLEPNNPFAFQATYLKALKRGLPLHLFGEFASQIEQDNSVKNRGAVFNIKVDEYFENRVRK